MATEKDLINAVRDSLEADGQLSQIKADMRMKVMKLLDGTSGPNKPSRPKAPHEVLVLNELIREYLQWIGYKYTSSVFVAECELSKQPLDRAFLARELCSSETEQSKELPLLLNIVEAFKASKDSS